MKNNEEKFKEFVGEARKDPNVIGFFLSGSRGKGLATKYADYDIEVVVKDKLLNLTRRNIKRKPNLLSDFRYFHFLNSKNMLKLEAHLNGTDRVIHILKLLLIKTDKFRN